jgi:hypothetical protein
VEGRARQAKSAEPHSSPDSVRASETARASISRAGFDGRRTVLLSSRGIQPSLRVSQPQDPAEREADRVADAVMAMPAPAPIATQRSPPAIHREPSAAGGPAAARPEVAAEVRSASGGGRPLPAKARGFLEPRFGASFAGVRVHTDAKAGKLANRLSAKAFTHGKDVFFGAGQFAPERKDGMHLLAHELTHTIQQGEAIQRKAVDGGSARVSERTPRQASRLGLSDALDYFADKANAIPGYRMFTILLGVNPINMSSVEASAANILRAIVEFLPGGFVITQVLDSYGIFDKVGGWIEGQLKSLGISGASIKAAIDKFLDSLSWKDIFNLGGVWNRAKAIFTEPIGKIIAFAKSLFGQILKMVQEAVMRPLAALAQRVGGYTLLKAVMGKDPVTGEAFPRTPETVIGGFMEMIGQQELWGNIQRAKAIPRAWAWFQTAMSGLVSLVSSIPDRFLSALKGLQIMDFVVLPSAFAKLASVFGTFLADFGSWALGTVIELAKIIVEVVAPGVMPYLQKAGAAFNTIVKNPVRFVQTLVAAAMQGFNQFKGNFLAHLKASLIGWLTGALGGAGVYVPQGFSLSEILKFVLSVLGLTWANLRGKLVKATSETTVKAFEEGFKLVQTLVKEGPAAAWQQILESLTNLKEMVINQAIDFVKSKVVEAAVTKLLSMLSPAGALIQAIIAIWNTIMFFKERISQIAQVAASFIDSIAAIAAGNIGPAANRVEQTMAGMLTLVISFLARIAGLGKVSDAILDIVKKIRAPIDKGMDKAVGWVVGQAKKLGRMIVQAGTPADPNKRLTQGLAAATAAVNAMSGTKVTIPLMRPVLAAIKMRYAFTSLEPVEQNGVWWVDGAINPRRRSKTAKLSKIQGLTPAQLGALLEPILVKVERAWMIEVGKASSKSSRTMGRLARSQIKQGGKKGYVKLPVMMSREQEIQLLRDLNRKKARIGRKPETTILGAVALTGGRYGGMMFVNEPGNMGRNIVMKAGDYLPGKGSIPDHIDEVTDTVRRRRVGDARAAVGGPAIGPLTQTQQAVVDAPINAEVLRELSPTRRRLTEALEPARADGGLVTRRLGEELAKSGQASVGEVSAGDLAPLAFKDASGGKMNEPAQKAERQRRIGNIIQRIRDVASRATILVEPNGPQFRRLGAAIESWLRSNSASMGKEEDPRRAEAAGRRLVDAFLAFLRSQQGG